MIDKRNARLDELLASGTDVLRAATSDGPSPDLVSLTIGAIRSLETGSKFQTRPVAADRPTKRRHRWSRVIRYSAFTAAIVLFAMFAGWFLLLDRTAPPAFAQVIEKVAKARFVTFVSESSVNDSDTDGRKEHVKWYVQGQQIRMEDVAGTTALIIDGEQQRHSKLDLKRKVATAEPLDDEVAEMIANPVSQIQKLRADDAQLIGEEELDGRAVHLYRLDKVEFLLVRGRGQMTVWVDPQTQLPVKIVLEPTKRNVRSGYTEISDFEWNKKLDESLFQIPADYTIIDERRKPIER